MSYQAGTLFQKSANITLPPQKTQNLLHIIYLTLTLVDFHALNTRIIFIEDAVFPNKS